MKLLQDLWAHLKEWFKAGIVAIIVIVVLQSMIG